jgi:hypothetical protein
VLRWQTASETDNAGFRVQHAAPESDFRTVTFVEGAGTTQQTRRYQHRIEGLAAGTHRFRLEQVDTDGTTTRSEPVEVAVGLQQPVRLTPPRPHPVRGRSILQFTVRAAQPVTATLYNVLGQPVRTLYDGVPPATQAQTLTLDADGLASGVYVLRVTGRTFTQTRRVTVVR